MNLKVATRMLERLGCEVDTVVSGVEALFRMEATSYDLVFMDCMMPGMDGYETVRRISRAQARRRR
ncbi:MAG: response regulator [Candidatus Eisenbacteria bacterium]